MDHNQAEVVMHFKDGRLDLRTVHFTFNPSLPSVNQGSTTYEPGHDGRCWLGVKTAQFEGWKQTTMIDTSYPHDGIFTVDGAPESEGEWLWFPVKDSRKQVTTYTDRT